ncbi:MAG: hypothetical protein WAU36_15100, partial [Cyclobacteriaceae bacterium]
MIEGILRSASFVSLAQKCGVCWGLPLRQLADRNDENTLFRPDSVMNNLKKSDYLIIHRLNQYLI